ncbi:MAG TPA: methyltransferase domain-containing protein [Pseudolabrys sp.]|nr:methyltransferase domain-containing protein [Pseudolabrys sp.]
MSQTLSQQQFGKNAAFYLTSTPHSLGKSLERLVTLTAPDKTWRVLDIATGGGHVAYTFAPHVARVWATDITQEMLDMVKAEAAKRGLSNLRTTYAKAETLPFEDGSFDLVTCRIAPHHFDSIPDYLAESHRVLKEGGTIAVVDNIVPAGPVGDYINAFERLRDPSHLRAWTMPEWRTAIAKAGFKIAHEEELDKRMEFKSWSQRYDDVMKALLRAMLTQLTPEVKAALNPEDGADGLYFHLREGLFIAKRA